MGRGHPRPRKEVKKMSSEERQTIVRDIVRLVNKAANVQAEEAARNMPLLTACYELGRLSAQNEKPGE